MSRLFLERGTECSACCIRRVLSELSIDAAEMQKQVSFEIRSAKIVFSVLVSFRLIQVSLF